MNPAARIPMKGPERGAAGATTARVLGYLGMGALGFALAVVLLWSPAGDPILQKLRGGPRIGEVSDGGSDPNEPKGLWTCGMHPNVIENAPGNCPICGMKLVPMRGSEEEPPGGAADQGERKVLFYRNPMDPTVTSPVPMKDSMGMDYVPVYSDEVEGRSGPAVRIDPGMVQNMGVTTQPVTRRDLKRRIRTVGYLGYDQEKMVTVTTKYTGFVEKVYVNFIGQPVKSGDALFEIYSPELLQTEQELLSAIEFSKRMQDAPADVRKRADELVVAARTRLSYWDINSAQVEQLERTSKVFRTLTVTSPVSGVVMKRANALEGMAVRPGMDVIHIADLSSLWLGVEVFEDQLAWLKEGSAASVSFTYFPGRSFEGKVRFVEPEVSEETRTVRLTLEIPNPAGELRSGMYATVEFSPVVVRDAVAVPAQSILRTGTRNVAVVALGGGRFEPRQVKLGPEGEGWVQVLEGLREGDELVVSSQFLIDSESSLRQAILRLVAGNRSGAEEAE